MLSRPRRTLDLLSISALDLFASALGVFVLMAVLLFPFYLKQPSIEADLAGATAQMTAAGMALTEETSPPPSDVAAGVGAGSALLVGFTGAHLVNDFNALMLPAFLPAMTDEFDLSYLQLGILSLSFTIMSGLLQVSFGHYADRYGRRRRALVRLGLQEAEGDRGGPPDVLVEPSVHGDALSRPEGRRDRGPLV